MERKTLATTIMCVVGLASFIGTITRPPSDEPTGCPSTHSKYSPKMESQIQELCVWGLGRDEAISGLESIYRLPGINHDAAVKLVQLGADLAAHHANPDPWKK
jgi:hypothetical protein